MRHAILPPARLFLPLLGVFAAGFTLQGVSAEESSPAAATAKEPKALEILAKAADAQAGLAAYQVETKIVMKMSMGDMNLDSTIHYALKLVRPNRFTMTGTGEGMMAMAMQNYYCDGTTLYTSMPGINSYMSEPAPPRFEEMGSAGGGMGAMNPAAMLANITGAGDPARRLEGIAEARWIGAETLDGTTFDHIRIVNEAGGMKAASDLWFSQGDPPLPRRIVPDLSNLQEAAAKIGDQVGDSIGQSASGVDVQSMVKGLKSQMEINFLNWKPGEAAPEESFKFTPPAGAKKVDSLMGAMMEQAGAMIGGTQPGGATPAAELEDGGRAEDLEKRSAPPLALPLKGGGSFDLSAQKGKGRVVLCFFSPTSAPSAKALAALDGLLSGMAGVTFVPVAMVHADGDLETFASANRLKAAIAIDKDGKAGKTYRAESLPQTVIIGTDGVIAHVRIGFSSKLADHVKEELEAGK